VPLTPQDVQNKLFTKTFRGYDMEEVDGFLDEFEAELGRLLRENNDLRNNGSRPAAPVQKQPTPEAQAAPVAASTGVDPAELQQAALRVLGMAEQTLNSARLEAAEKLGSARTEAAALLESARAEASQVVAAAREEADKTLSPARAEADQLRTQSREQAGRALADATAEAERLAAQARAAREQADAELSAKVAGATHGLEARRTALESHIEDLRSFEREYRSRLKAYLVGQLGDLDGRVVPEDGGAGVPSPGRAGNDTAGVPAGAELDLSDDAPDMEADADRDVPLGQRSATAPQEGAPGVGS